MVQRWMTYLTKYLIYDLLPPTHFTSWLQRADVNQKLPGSVLEVRKGH